MGFADTRITKSNTSLWILTGSNTYTGPTTISGGTLQIGNGGNTGTLGLGSGTLGLSAVTDNATLVFDRSDNGLVVANAISGSGNVAQIGTGLLTLSVSNSYSGGTSISSGTLSATNNASLGNNSAVTMNPGGSAALLFSSSAPSIGSLTSGGAGLSRVVLVRAAAPPA